MQNSDNLELSSSRELQRSLGRYVAVKLLTFLALADPAVQLIPCRPFSPFQVKEKQARAGHRSRRHAQDVPLSLRRLQSSLRSHQQFSGKTPQPVLSLSIAWSSLGRLKVTVCCLESRESSSQERKDQGLPSPRLWKEVLPVQPPAPSHDHPLRWAVNT